jgi:hypothetical protein
MNNKKTALFWLLLLFICYIACKRENKISDALSPIPDLTAFKSKPGSPDHSSICIAMGTHGNPGDTSPLWFLAKR